MTPFSDNQKVVDESHQLAVGKDIQFFALIDVRFSETTRNLDQTIRSGLCKFTCKPAVVSIALGPNGDTFLGNDVFIGLGDV